MKENNSSNNSIDTSLPDKGLEDKIRFGRFVLIVIIILGELFIYTWCRVSYTETGFRISRHKDEQKILKAYTDALSMEHDRLLSPERIAYIATKRLQLIIPEPNQIIYMDM